MLKRLSTFLPLLLLLGGVDGLEAANPLTEELASVHGKASAGDAYYQGALALFHRHAREKRCGVYPSAQKNNMHNQSENPEFTNLYMSQINRVTGKRIVSNW